MASFHVATSSLNLTPLDWEGNARIISDTIKASKEAGVDILCLPELCVSGYGCEDMFFADWVFAKALDILSTLVNSTENITCILGCPILYEGQRYNCAVVISNKKIIGIVPKQNLANSGVYYESRWFVPWTGAAGEISVNGVSIPFGKLLFELRGIRFGIEVCEDAWVENRPLRYFKDSGVSFVLNPSASHFSLGKFKQRIELSKSATSLVGDLVYVYANHQGNEAGRLIYDGGSFISRGEEILSLTRRFSFKDFELASSCLDFAEKDLAAGSSEYLICKIPEVSSSSRVTEFSFKATPYISKEEEFTRAVSLALFDYLRKSKHRAFVVSLSGGADSSACAILSYLSLSLALKDRGEVYLKNVLGQKDLASIDFSKAIICAYLGTSNSSDETFNASKFLAADIGAKFINYEIDDLIASYTNKIEESFQKVSWEKNDVPLQNIQARSRGPLVWFLANLSGGLLLSTSNRSEAAVGYTTMDGDTCGGISPIGGINKTFLLSWLNWLADSKNHSFGSFPSLLKVLSNKPTAELRPKEFSQTDEADLMPYEILDYIEKRFLIDRYQDIEIVKAVVGEFSVEESEAKAMVSKFFTLWTRNQWKRERYAPSFHIDEENLDPKTWCRYPILSGSIA